MDSICVFCGSHVGEKPGYLKAAANLGAILAERGIHLIYGGSNIGLMGMVANSCLEKGGRVTGIMPRHLEEKGVAHDQLTELIVVDSMHQRKARMAELSDAFIALPGGIGTLEETLEMLTWVQLGIQAKPIGLLNALSYFDSLMTFFRHMVAEGFLRTGHLEMLLIESDAEKLVTRLQMYKPRYLDKWANKQ